MKLLIKPCAAVLVTMPLLTAGCIWQVPSDLTFNSIQVVDWRDRDELPGPGASPLVGLVSDSRLKEFGNTTSRRQKWPRKYLKIEFTTETNLEKFSNSNSYNIGNTAEYCDEASGHYSMSNSAVFKLGFRLGPYGSGFIERIAEGVAPFVYYSFIDIYYPPSPTTYPASPFIRNGFNLQEQPKDLCFYLAGGNGVTGYKSNTMVIPKAAIEAALSHLPPDAARWEWPKY